MSRWFRHYAGMMRDEKLVRVAVRSKQTVERVVWVWGAILESAAEINDAGRYEFDTGEAAYFLRCDEDELVRIVSGLEDSGRISGGVIVRWSDRQFDSDSAKERQRRYRERRKAANHILERDDDVGEASQTVTRDVTVTSRDGAVTLQETDTDTYQKEEPNGSSKKRGTRLPDDFIPSQQAAQDAGLSQAEAEREALKFRDHWISQPGQRGVKLDWPATWRNWCRHAVERRPMPRNTSPPRKTVGDIFRDDAKRMGLIPDDKPPGTIDGHLETGNGSRESGGTGISRRFTVSADILGRLG